MNTRQQLTSANEKATAQTVAISNSQQQLTSTPIFGQSDKTIKAFCIASRPEWRHGRKNHLWTLTVPVCPLCGKRHTHGGGVDATPSFGHRVAHCVDGTGGYVLTLATEGGAV